MAVKTPVWEERHTRISKRLEADLRAGEDQHVTYPSHEAFMEDLHGSSLK